MTFAKAGISRKFRQTKSAVVVLEWSYYITIRLFTSLRLLTLFTFSWLPTIFFTTLFVAFFSQASALMPEVISMKSAQKGRNSFGVLHLLLRF